MHPWMNDEIDSCLATDKGTTEKISISSLVSSSVAKQSLLTCYSLFFLE